MLSTYKGTGCTYLPTNYTTSILGLLKCVSNNSVQHHPSEKHSLRLHSTSENLVSVSRGKTGSECQAEWEKKKLGPGKVGVLILPLQFFLKN